MHLLHTITNLTNSKAIEFKYINYLAAPYLTVKYHIDELFNLITVRDKLCLTIL